MFYTECLNKVRNVYLIHVMPLITARWSRFIRLYLCTINIEQMSLIGVLYGDYTTAAIGSSGYYIIW